MDICISRLISSIILNVSNRDLDAAFRNGLAMPPNVAPKARDLAISTPVRMPPEANILIFASALRMLRIESLVGITQKINAAASRAWF